MKKLLFPLIIIFALLGNSTPSDASILRGLSAGVLGIPATSNFYCNSCPDATAGGDEICEVSDGTADGLCGWTIVETGGATGEVDFNATCDDSPALGCDDVPMTKCVAITKTNATAGANHYAYKSIADGTAAYETVAIKILSESIGNGEGASLFKLGYDTDGSGSVLILLYQTEGGDLRFNMGYHVGGTWLFDLGNTNISSDTWYTLRVKALNPAGGGSDSVQWWVDYSNSGSFTDEGTTSGLTLDRAIQYATIGEADNAVPISYQIAFVKWDNDTMPAACIRTTPETGTVYHVRIADGSDTVCNGLYNAPDSAAPNCAFQTPQKGVNSASAGNIVRLHTGDYSGTVPSFTTVTSGTSGNYITIEAASGETVSISRAVINHNYVKVDGLRVINPGGLAASGIRVGPDVSYVTISNNDFFGTGYSFAHAIVVAFWGDNITITGNTFDGGSSLGASFEKVIYVGGNNISITGNTFKNLDSPDLVFELYGDGHTISGNEAYGIIQSDGAIHIDFFQLISNDLDSQNIVVEKNYFHDCISQIANLHLDWITTATYSWVFRNNVVANVTATAFVYVPNVDFYNNTFYNTATSTNQEWVIQYGGSGTGSVKNNAFVGCGVGDPQTKGWYNGTVGYYNFVSTLAGALKTGFDGEGGTGINGGTPDFVAPYTNCILNVCDFDVGGSSDFTEEGTDLSGEGFSEDYDEIARPQGALWDIGAYEN